MASFLPHQFSIFKRIDQSFALRWNRCMLPVSHHQSLLVYKQKLWSKHRQAKLSAALPTMTRVMAVIYRLRQLLATCVWSHVVCSRETGKANQKACLANEPRWMLVHVTKTLLTATQHFVETLCYCRQITKRKRVKMRQKIF